MENQDVMVALPDLLGCPEPTCQAPATVLDRFVLWSTSGPVEHAKTSCLAGHGFTPTTDTLAGWPVMDARPALGATG
jgi:hypothetical protein